MQTRDRRGETSGERNASESSASSRGIIWPWADHERDPGDDPRTSYLGHPFKTMHFEDDNDLPPLLAKEGACEILKTPYRAPRANAICERFPRSVRQACAFRLLLLHEKQLQRVLNQYVAYFNRARPHQGIQQQLPEPPASPAPSHHQSNRSLTGLF